jgi:hypothetical protein
MNGGIGYSKWNGNYFIYKAVAEDAAKRSARSFGGEIAGLLVKSSTNDRIVRTRITSVRPEIAARWKMQ